MSPFRIGADKTLLLLDVSVPLTFPLEYLRTKCPPRKDVSPRAVPTRTHQRPGKNPANILCINALRKFHVSDSHARHPKPTPEIIENVHKVDV